MIFELEKKRIEELNVFLKKLMGLFPSNKLPSSLLLSNFMIHDKLLLEYLDEVTPQQLKVYENDPEIWNEFKKEVSAFFKCFSCLSENERTLIFYLFLQNFSEEKTAQKTNFSKATVQRKRKQILHKIAIDMYFLKKIEI